MLAACYSQTDKGQQPPNAEQKIRRIETLRLQYPLEPARWADHVDDNAVFTPGSGKVNTKTEILRLLHQQEWSYDSSLEMHEEQFKQLGGYRRPHLHLHSESTGCLQEPVALM